MIGLILCGGQSSRMGSDKGLLLHGGISWAAHAAAKLIGLGLETYISVNENQYVQYAEIFSREMLIVDSRDKIIKGPLSGLYAAHQQFPRQDLFILACDLVLMDSMVLTSLLKQRNRYETFDAYICNNQGQLEPMCGIYTSAGLKLIVDRIRNGKLSRSSMKQALGLLRVNEQFAADTELHFFKNFNHPGEVA